MNFKAQRETPVFAMDEEDPGPRPSARFAELRKHKKSEAKRKEAERLLGSLEQRIGELVEISNELKSKGVDIQLQDYMRFQDLMSECLTFLIIIEKRLQKLEGTFVEGLYDKFDQLVVAIWSILLKGALRFFRIISEEEHLPLGSKDVFARELRSLHEAQEKLTSERYVKRVSKKMNKKLEKAELILLEVIEKAPGLLKL